MHSGQQSYVRINESDQQRAIIALRRLLAAHTLRVLGCSGRLDLRVQHPALRLPDQPLLCRHSLLPFLKVATAERRVQQRVALVVLKFWLNEFALGHWGGRLRDLLSELSGRLGAWQLYLVFYKTLQTLPRVVAAV